MESNTTNFGDIVAAMIKKENDDRKQAQAEKAAEDARFLHVMQTACAPLLKVITQTKEKFPRLNAFDLDSSFPRFFISGNTSIKIKFNESPMLFQLYEAGSIDNGYKDKIHAESISVEDLIPKLLELLKIAVTYRR
jgi:hypothetical protein